MTTKVDARSVRASWRPSQRLKNDAIYGAAIVALAIVRRLPRRVLVSFGRVVGAVAWVVAGAARRRAIANVARALPEANAPRLVRRCFVELGAMLGDTIALLDLRSAAALPFLPGARETLEAARAEGRGVILVTAHLGAWERLAASLVEAGFPLTTPVRVSYDPRLEAHVVGPLRALRGVSAIDRDAPGTPRALVRALRAGEIAGFLVDLDTRVSSVPAPFFGCEARTPSGPARLALQLGAPVVAAFATRDGIAVELLRPASARGEASHEAVTELVTAMNRSIERAIRREPTRWIWMHDRWGDARRQNEKSPRDAGPSHEEELEA